MDKQQETWVTAVALAFEWVDPPHRIEDRGEALGEVAATAMDIYVLMHNLPPDPTGNEYNWTGETLEQSNDVPSERPEKA